MAKDGTNRGGRRVRDGAKPEALNDKLAAGRPATRLTTPAELDVFDLDGTDIGDGALLAGEPMPEPGEYLSAEQRDGQPLGADLVYRETWNWLDERGCTEFVSKRLIEQCEQAISKFGLLGKHPTTGAAIASRSWPCRSRSASRPTCTGTRSSTSCAPPAPPTTPAPRQAMRSWSSCSKPPPKTSHPARFVSCLPDTGRAFLLFAFVKGVLACL